MTPGAATKTKTRTYAQLLAEYEPRSIENEEQAIALAQILNQFLDIAEPTSDGVAFRDLLGDLLYVWEQDNTEIANVPVNERIRALLEDNGLRQKDLVPAVFPTESVASEVITGKRPLTYDFANRLADYFQISPAFFFPASPEPLNTAGAIERALKDASIGFDEARMRDVESPR